MDWSTLNPEVIREFRANAGKVARFGDLPVVILNTVGARTGRILEVPLITVLDDGEMLLFASNAGSQRHPVWIHNVRAHPKSWPKRSGPPESPCRRDGRISSQPT